MSDDAQNRAFDEPKDDEEGGPPSPEDRHVSHLLAWAAIMLQVLSMAPPRASDLWGSGHVEGNLLDTRLDEISGLAFDATGRYLWAHNDSGDTPRLFALTRAGELASTRPLRTPYLEDVEAIAAGPCAPGQSRRCLFVADIGDNRHQRDHVHIVRIPAPEDPGAEGALTPDHVMHLRHPGGPHDAESMLLDPMSGRLWIVEKSREGPTRALAVPERAWRPHEGDAPVELEPAATVALEAATIGGRLVTDGAISPDGRCVALRTYLHLHTWCRRDGEGLMRALERPGDVARPPAMLQSEAIAWHPDGELLYLTSERWPAPLVALERRDGN